MGGINLASTCQSCLTDIIQLVRIAAFSYRNLATTKIPCLLRSAATVKYGEAQATIRNNRARF